MSESLFNKVRFSFDQFSAQDDLRWKETVRKYQGRIDYIVTNLTDYVVCPDVDSAIFHTTKMVCAERYEVPVVGVEFIARCIEFRRIIPLDDALYGDYARKKEEIVVVEKKVDQISVILDDEEHLDVQWRTARVFISSTFRDMHGERDYLTRRVFPELQERCKKLKLHVHPVDLRWGVTSEDTENALELCLTEVDSCRPFFIGILGNRYGWCPEEYVLPNEERFDWVESIPLGKSVTHLEMMYGMLRNPGETKGAIYIRDSSVIPNIPSEYRDDFVESKQTSAIALEELKSEIRSKCLNVFDNYPCDWQGVVEEKPMVGNLEAFGAHVLDTLWEHMQQEYPISYLESDPLDIARNYHLSFIESHSRLFVGRKSLIQAITDYVFKSDIVPLVIVGQPGSGKTSLVSYFTSSFINDMVNRAGYHIIPHFIGAEPGSTAIRHSLIRLIKEMNKVFNLQIEKIPDEYKEIQQLFLSCFETIATLESTKFILIIDAINQLDSTDSSSHLEWLPKTLPNNVKIILSTLEGDFFDALTSREVEVISVEGLSHLEQEEIVEKSLWEYRKKLEQSQMDLLLMKEDAFKPLYLKVAAEELRVFGVFEKISGFIDTLPENVPELFETVIRRLEKDHGYDIVKWALSLITCSRGGLLEVEMVHLLGENNIPIPHHIWSSLYRGLTNYLRPPGEGGEGILDFFHQQLPKAVKRLYLKEDKYFLMEVHAKLGHYFWSKADPSLDGSWSEDYPRGINYAPYHLTVAENWTALKNSLCNLQFIELKCKQKLTYDLVNDFIVLLDYDNSMNPEEITIFKQYRRFVLGRAHILAKNPALTFTMAISLPNSSHPSSDAFTRYYVTGQETRPFFKWENKSEQPDPCIMTLSGHSMVVRSCGITNRTILAGADDGTLKIYDSSTGAEIITLRGHTNSIMSCKFFQNGRKIISASYDRTLIIYDAYTGACESVIQAHRSVVLSCDVSQEQIIASSSKDLTVALWRKGRGAYAKINSFTTEAIPTCVRFNSTGDLLAVGDEKGKVIIYDVHQNVITEQFQFHEAQINSVRFSADGTLLLCSSEDRTVVLIDLQTKLVRFTLTGHKDGVTCAVFDHKEKTIATGSHDNMINVWDVTFGTKLCTFIGHTGSVFSVEFSDDDSLIVSSSFDRTVKVWEVTGELSFVGHEARILSTQFSPDGSLIATGSRDKTIKIWSTETHDELWHIKGHVNNVFAVAWSPNGKHLCSGGRDFSVRIWKTCPGVKPSMVFNLQNHTAPIRSVDWSPDARLVAATSEDKTISVYDSPNSFALKFKLEDHKEAVTACKFSHSGRRLVTGSEDGTIILWNTHKNQSTEYGDKPFTRVAKMKGHTNLIQSLRFSEDDKLLLSGSDDKTAILWNTKNAKIIKILEGHEQPVRECCFTGDGKFIVTASTDSNMIMWDINTYKSVISFASLSRLCCLDTTYRNDKTQIALGDGSGILYILTPVGLKL